MSRVARAGIATGIAVSVAAAGLTAASASPPGTATARGIAPVPASQDARPDRTFTVADRDAALRTARAEETTIAAKLGLTGAQRLHVRDVQRDADGTLHVRYNRTLGGLPVMGGDFVVHEAPSGSIESTDWATEQPLSLRTDVKTRVTSQRAVQIAAKGAEGTSARASDAQKVVWAVSGVPRLAWLTHVRGRDYLGNPMPRAVVIDARTGTRIQSWDLHETAKGSGRSLYSGKVRLTTTKKGHNFLLKDGSRGGAATVDLHGKFENPPGEPPLVSGPVFKDGDNHWGNGKASNRQSAAVDVAYGTAKTWDFYRKTFHRKGIADNGKGAKSRVHFATGYDNAFWSDACFCMTYGDGGTNFKPLVELDVAGHEMTHGVTSHTAGLYYFGDSGGLNESTSDIFGTLVEFFAKNKADKPDYLIGEKIVKPAFGEKSLRRMDNPQLDGLSFNCWGQQMGLANPHFTSGPGNHFFYLLAEGSGKKTISGVKHNSPRCAGAAKVQGIGRAKAGDIWYRALTRYFVSTTGYVDARDSTIHAAIDLYGENSSECRQVVKAWNAVDVPPQFWTCAGSAGFGQNSFGASPGFEPPNGSWTFSNQAIVTQNPNIGIPRRGQFFGTTNGLGSNNVGTLSTTVTIPDSPTATLRFYMLVSIASTATGDTTSGTGTVDILFNGNQIGHFDQSYANNTYQRWEIPVDTFAGQTGTLSIVGDEDPPALTGGFFQTMFDDFSLTPR